MTVLQYINFCNHRKIGLVKDAYFNSTNGLHIYLISFKNQDALKPGKVTCSEILDLQLKSNLLVINWVYCISW